MSDSLLFAIIAHLAPTLAAVAALLAALHNRRQLRDVHTKQDALCVHLNGGLELALRQAYALGVAEGQARRAGTEEHM